MFCSMFNQEHCSNPVIPLSPENEEKEWWKNMPCLGDTNNFLWDGEEFDSWSSW